MVPSNVPFITPKDLVHPKIFAANVITNLSSDFRIQSRLYAIVLCAWIVTYYLCVELANEWKDILKLRRKYYFEADHYQDRMKQVRKNEEDSRLESAFDLGNRDPWIPHPEHRNTVSNIGLYSLLCGNIPSLPLKEAKNYTAQQEMDWKIALTTAFFDSCVPSQHGFSSAVAAITFLPDAKQLRSAWRQWNRTAAALRRLRFIRSVIKERFPGTLQEYTGYNEKYPMASKIFLETQENVECFVQTDDDIESYLKSLRYGDEQIDVYAFQYASAASGCCPFGFGEYINRYMKLEKLLQLERESLLNVQQETDLLVEIQTQAAAQIPRSSRASVLPERFSQQLKKKKYLSLDERDLNQSQNYDEYRNDGALISPSKTWLQHGLLYYFSLDNMTKCCRSSYKFRQQSSFAVITFTSRQAAATVRQSLIDGKGGSKFHL